MVNDHTSEDVRKHVPPKAKSLYFVAGEASGDNHGAALMSSLRKRDVDLATASPSKGGLNFFGRGGPQMRAIAGANFTDWLGEAAVLGLWEVIKKYGYFRKQFHETLGEIEKAKPDAVVLIDYPGFNLRLARTLREKSPQQKIIYYISPQVWAWNRGRIEKMAQFLDLMLCIFPFEAELYNKSGLRTEFVGHPMIDRLRGLKIDPLRARRAAGSQNQLDRPAPSNTAIRTEPAGEAKVLPAAGGSGDIERDPNLIGLFPGSRRREVRKIFPIMIAAANELARSKPQLRFEVAAASQELAAEMNEMLRPGQHLFQITTGETAAIMQRAFVGIVASGSATLEAAYFRMPFVLVYKVAWPTYLAARMVVNVKHLGMPNVLANKEVVPEFIQHRASPVAIAETVSRLMKDAGAREKMIAEFDSVIAKLGQGGASDKAARAIIEELGAMMENR